MNIGKIIYWDEQLQFSAEDTGSKTKKRATVWIGSEFPHYLKITLEQKLLSALMLCEKSKTKFGKNLM